MTRLRWHLDPAWLVLLAGVSAALHVGKLPPALPVLQASLGLSLVQAGFMLSLVQVAGLSLGLVAGLMADSLGLRRCMLWGLGVLAVASGAGGGVQQIWALLALRALEGAGFLMAVMPAPGLIRRAVVSHRLARMMGWWGGYMPVGTALALALGPWVLGMGGREAWWWGLGALSALMALAVWRWVPQDPVTLPVASGGWWARIARTVSTPGPGLAAVCFALYSAQWLAVIGFLPSVYAQAGWSSAWAGWLSAGVAAINIVGNVAAGQALQRHVAPGRLLWLGYGSMALGALATFSGLWPVVVALCGAPLWVAAALSYGSILVFSACGGLIPGTLFALVVRVAPSDDTVSTTVGWMQQWSALGQFLGPPLAAWVAAQVGGWQFTGGVTAACAALGAVVAWRLTRWLAHATQVRQV